MFLLIFTLVGATIFAILSRAAGGGKPDLPFGLDQHLYALPYAILGFVLNPVCGVASYATAFLGKRTGHGRGISLKEPMKPGSEPEKIEVLILWTQKYLPVYWYKFLILLLTGMLVPLGLTIALFAHGLYVYGSLVFLGGAAKALAYAIGWSDLQMKYLKKEPTVVGEYLTGFFGGLPVFLMIGTCVLLLLTLLGY